MEGAFSWSGMMALGLFASAFLAGIRWVPWVRLVGGLARIHRIHHLLGACTFVGVLLHIGAELYAFPPSAWRALLDPRVPGMLTAFLALLFFAAAFGGIFVSLSHRAWLHVHWLFALSFALAGIHAMAFARHPIAILTLLGIGGLGILILVSWHLVVGTGSRLEVIEVKQSGAQIYSLLLHPHPVDSDRFRAGMVVYLRFSEGTFSRSWHPFSIASCRTSKEIRLVIKSLGRDTRHLLDLKPGSLVDLHGPYEELSIPEGVDQVWIAGGVGIAPFLGMAHCLSLKGDCQVRLFHYSRPGDPTFYADELDGVVTELPRFQWKRIEVPEPALPDLGPVVKNAATLKTPYFLLSGPPKFMRYARGKLRASGVRRRQIITEEFVPW